MGLDVYAGTLTRYYSNDWETSWAQRAREAGMLSETIRFDESGAYEPEQRKDPAELHRSVLAWREALNEQVLDASAPRLDWDE